MKLILTVPAYARFEEVAKKPAVEAIRLNTTLPLRHGDSYEDVLANVKAQADPKPVLIDLKCRQMRITDYNVKILNDGEFHYITLSHDIQVDTPVEMYLDDGNFVGRIERIIDGDTLVVPSSVERRSGLPLTSQGEVGIRPSMSINIMDPSLEIDGYLTEKDKKYIDAAKNLGMHDYMLSYVEEESDLTDVWDLHPEANLIAKIESKGGLEFFRDVYPKYQDKVTLMAARGDLYMEMDRPDHVIDACEEIIQADEKAILASRVLSSLKDVDKIPDCQDLSDVYCWMQRGYKRFMVGDDVCLKEDSVRAAIGLFDVIADKYRKYGPPVGVKTRSLLSFLKGKKEPCWK